MSRGFYFIIAITMTARPKIVDIAREAGVSPATVDRVLNGRAGVSNSTVSRVSDAVKKLDYVRDVSAANLAKKRRYRMVFALPEDGGQFQEVLCSEIASVSRHAQIERTEISLLPVPTDDPHALARIIGDMDPASVDGLALMAPETPQLRDAIRLLKNKGVPVVAMVSNLPNTDCDHFVGINNVAAGRTAGTLMGRFAGRRKGRILVLARSMQSHDSIERRLGFDAVMQEQFPDLYVLPSMESHGNAEKMEKSIHHAFAQHDDILGIYSVSSGNRILSNLLQQRQTLEHLIVVAHELTPHNREALKSGLFDAVITQNTGHVVRSAIRVLRAKSDQLEIDKAQESIRIEIVLKENLYDPAV